jgi:SAM-dependent methyltransferase
LLDAAEVTAGTALLDVATGPGVVALAARDRGARVTAVDQSTAMVAMAGSAGLDTCQASADQLPFATGAFDAVVASFLINHLARPVEAVAELRRVCETRVAVSVWDTPAANPALGLFGVVAQSFDIADSAPPGPDSSLYADDTNLAALLVAAGLVDVRITRIRWTLTVAPGAWFDAVAAGTPRTGAVLAAASATQRAALRKDYVEAANASYADVAGRVTLPAAAVVGSGRSKVADPGGLRSAGAA